VTDAAADTLGAQPFSELMEQGARMSRGEAATYAAAGGTAG